MWVGPEQHDVILHPNFASSVSFQQLWVCVSGVSAFVQKELSVKEGESVTLDPGVMKNPNDLMAWHFNETFIAVITGNHSKICMDYQCVLRFSGRLTVDHQTGSLTIMNIRTTDSGI